MQVSELYGITTYVFQLLLIILKFVGLITYNWLIVFIPIWLMILMAIITAINKRI